MLGTRLTSSSSFSLTDPPPDRPILAGEGIPLVAGEAEESRIESFSLFVDLVEDVWVKQGVSMRRGLASVHRIGVLVTARNSTCQGRYPVGDGGDTNRRNVNRENEIMYTNHMYASICLLHMCMYV